ncbi:putative gustatory receptor 36c [Zeugodacus cucurbitae]|uniref:putative gustatory receptor 36c n=1 Tax=Zeugodacus cucurbitae TaxID=28588 RepID=UPI0023D91D44|nr:putative gustatory receptor 36c [Zeugodacus cucurbitae]
MSFNAVATRRWQLYTYYYALLIGLTAFRIDFVQRRIYRWPRMQIYACTLNALVVITLPLSYPISFEYLEYLNDNRLMKIVNAVNTTQLFSITVLAIVFRWKREHTITEILTRMLELEREYFQKCVPAAVKRYCEQIYSKRLLWIKYFSVITQTLSTAFNLFTLVPELKFIWLLYAVHMICVISVILHMILHYFLAMWYLWQRFCWLNVQLLRIFNTLEQLTHERYGLTLRRRMRRRLARELMDVARVHRQLTGFAERLTDCYRLQIVAVLLSKIINNISIGYLCFKYRSNSYLKSLGAFTQTFSCLALVMTLSDSFFLDILCERVVIAALETAEVLKRFHELLIVDDRLEYACDLLAQHLRQCKLRISIFGVIDVNKRLSFLVFGGFLKNVLLLLQWDLAKQFE